MSVPTLAAPVPAVLVKVNSIAFVPVRLLASIVTTSAVAVVATFAAVTFMTPSVEVAKVLANPPSVQIMSPT